MSRYMFFLPAFLLFVAPSSALNAGVFVHCAEFSGDPRQSQRLAWFEVFDGGPVPSEASHAKGYYSVKELNGKTVGCRLGGHEYAFGVTEYREVTSSIGSLDVYRVRLVIDGVQMWISEENPPDSIKKAAAGDYVPFVGTVRIDSSMVSICRLGSITDIGDFAVPPAAAEPITKPEMSAWEYVGYRYGCERHYLRMPEPSRASSP